jgi:hypothetical protein
MQHHIIPKVEITGRGNPQGYWAHYFKGGIQGVVEKGRFPRLRFIKNF